MIHVLLTSFFVAFVASIYVTLYRNEKPKRLSKVKSQVLPSSNCILVVIVGGLNYTALAHNLILKLSQLHNGKIKLFVPSDESNFRRMDLVGYRFIVLILGEPVELPGRICCSRNSIFIALTSSEIDKCCFDSWESLLNQEGTSIALRHIIAKDISDESKISEIGSKIVQVFGTKIPNLNNLVDDLHMNRIETSNIMKIS